jgi:hypothetical protein
MARRPEPDQILTAEQLAHYRIQLARLSPSSLAGVYQSALEECRFDGKNIPSAAAIQSLVAVWKELRKFHQPMRRSGGWIVQTARKKGKPLPQQLRQLYIFARSSPQDVGVASPYVNML